jgi:tetratricopeptide (TPR) repeat protein
MAIGSAAASISIPRMKLRARWGVGLLLAITGCAPAATVGSTRTTPEAQGTGGKAPAPAAGPTVDSWASGAMLFDDLGPFHRGITTTSKEAQAYFDQGMKLTYGFNHDEATRSFARAAQLDPNCAACFWGVALTLGPNYNVPMLPDRAQVAWDALEKAKALAPKASPVEQALIGALSKRYKGPGPVDPPAMQPFNEAFAAAMREVGNQFPADLDVQVMFAEAMMNVNPWKLWTLDGKPNPGTPEIVSTLESVLAKDAKHPGANHYYIHAIEASEHPEKGLASAERLAGLLPGAGHVVHMPAHIYQRVGRYSDASEHNRKAVEVDKRYLARTKPPGYYPMYLGHNYGFLAYSSAMEGRAAESLTAARESAKAIPPEMLSMMPGMDFFTSEPLLVLVRFGRWDELLAEPRPPEKYPVMLSIWLHAHGMALASRGKLDEAQQHHTELVALRDKLPADLLAGLNPARTVADLGAKILEARLAQAKKQPNALALWADAVKIEDTLFYSEPADWFYPVRHFQGAALLAAGKAKEAEAVYREDLRRNPGNGWGLHGLVQALKAQKKKAAAEEASLKKAWERADQPTAAVVF